MRKSLLITAITLALSVPVEAVGFRVDLDRYGLHGEVDILTDTYRKYTQVEYKVGF